MVKVEKVKKARMIRGTRFLHILAPCPPGWKTQNDETIDLARMAVERRIFPLLEVENGGDWHVLELQAISNEGTDEEDALWPERYPYHVVSKIRENFQEGTKAKTRNTKLR